MEYNKEENQQIEVSNKNNQIEDAKKEEKKKITKHVEIRK